MLREGILLPDQRAIQGLLRPLPLQEGDSHQLPPDLALLESASLDPSDCESCGAAREEGLRTAAVRCLRRLGESPLNMDMMLHGGLHEASTALMGEIAMGEKGRLHHLPREARDEIIELREAMQGHARVQKMLRQAEISVEAPSSQPKPTREERQAEHRHGALMEHAPYEAILRLGASSAVRRDIARVQAASELEAARLREEAKQDSDAEWDRKIRKATGEDTRPYRGLGGLGGAKAKETTNRYLEGDEHGDRLRRLEEDMDTRLREMHYNMVAQKESYEGRLKSLEEELEAQTAFAKNKELWRQLDF